MPSVSAQFYSNPKYLCIFFNFCQWLRKPGQNPIERQVVFNKISQALERVSLCTVGRWVPQLECPGYTRTQKRIWSKIISLCEKYFPYIWCDWTIQRACKRQVCEMGVVNSSVNVLKEVFVAALIPFQDTLRIAVWIPLHWGDYI